jgi:hypothetical protein
MLPQHGTPQQATAADATTADQPMDVAGAASDGGGGAAELVVEVVDGLAAASPRVDFINIGFDNKKYPRSWENAVKLAKWSGTFMAKLKLP